MVSDRLLDILELQGWAALSDTDRAHGFLEIAESLGEPVAPFGRPIIQTLEPKSLDEAPPNTFSGRYGRSAFPFHTDLANWTTPPRYVLLRAVKPTTRATGYAGRSSRPIQVTSSRCPRWAARRGQEPEPHVQHEPDDQPAQRSTALTLSQKRHPPPGVLGALVPWWFGCHRVVTRPPPARKTRPQTQTTAATESPPWAFSRVPET